MSCITCSEINWRIFFYQKGRVFPFMWPMTMVVILKNVVPTPSNACYVHNNGKMYSLVRMLEESSLCMSFTDFLLKAHYFCFECSQISNKKHKQKFVPFHWNWIKKLPNRQSTLSFLFLKLLTLLYNQPYSSSIYFIHRPPLEISVFFFSSNMLASKVNEIH